MKFILNHDSTVKDKHFVKTPIRKRDHCPGFEGRNLLLAIFYKVLQNKNSDALFLCVYMILSKTIIFN